MRPAHDGGYASVSAIILCAALSVLCAGVLGLVMSQKKQAKRDLFRAQQTEAINTALLEFGVDIASKLGDATVSEDKTVYVPGGTMTVKLRGEFEGRKWPMERINDVDSSVLGQYLGAETSVGNGRTRSEASKGEGLAEGIGAEPLNDCVRILFSPYGQADIKKSLPKGVGLIALSSGHDGQVWRLRAVLGNRLEERRVRFLGEPNHIFAVVSQNDYALGEMPTCGRLKETP